MQKLKKIFSCLFSIFSSNTIHNNRNKMDRETNMNEQTTDINKEDISNAITRLSNEFKISSRYLLASVNAREPSVLSFAYKSAYKEVGICDREHKLTPFGEALFKHLDDEHAKTGLPKPEDLPCVVSSSFD